MPFSAAEWECPIQWRHRVVPVEPKGCQQSQLRSSISLCCRNWGSPSFWASFYACLWRQDIDNYRTKCVPGVGGGGWWVVVEMGLWPMFFWFLSCLSGWSTVWAMLSFACPLFHLPVPVPVCVCEKQANLQHTQACIHVHKFIVTGTTTTTAASNEWMNVSLGSGTLSSPVPVCPGL